MKKVLFVLLLVCGIGFIADAQTNTTSEEDYYKNLNLTAKDTLLFDYLDCFRRQLREPCYQLFKTQNTWTFLKLNTITGQIWQVQYSIDGAEYRFETALSTQKLISEDYDDPICGRFTLYPTNNMYNFILLDQIEGRCWQVQWSTESYERGVWRIY